MGVQDSAVFIDVIDTCDEINLEEKGVHEEMFHHLQKLQGNADNSIYKSEFMFKDSEKIQSWFQ